MNRIDTLLEKIRNRCGAFIGYKSLKNLSTFISGYYYGVFECEGVHFEFLEGFQKFVEDYYKIHKNIHWDKLIEANTLNDSDAFDIFFKIYDEFKKENVE